MTRDARLLVLVLGAAACGGRAKPASRPAPVPPTSSSASSTAANPLRVPSDTIPRVAIAIPDSVLTKQVVAVFGDSVIPVTDDSVVEGPTWDIDVRSYEAHRRVEFYVNAFTGSARERFISRLE